MFESLAADAAAARGAASVGAWARVENAACARRLSASADMLERAYSADGSAEREQWCLDNWDAVCAQVGAEQNVSSGVASHQLLIAIALRERLPRVAEVFAAGDISYRMVAAVVARTRLVLDAAAMLEIDARIAADIGQWGPLSVAKLETEIDYWVAHCDPAALRRNESKARDRHIDIHPPDDGSGVCVVEGAVSAHDGAVLDKRLDALADTVCERDPRTREQRRADALTPALHGAERLACHCGRETCEGATVADPSSLVIYVVANEESLTADTAIQLDGAYPPGPSGAELRTMTLKEALRPDKYDLGSESDILGDDYLADRARTAAGFL